MAIAANYTRKPRLGASATCGVAKMLPVLSEEDRVFVLQELKNPYSNARALATALQEEYGDDIVSHYTLRRHRKGECKCAKDQ